MNLGYRKHFPFNGQWTNFKHKIYASFPVRIQRDAAKALCANLPESQRVAYITLFMDNMGVDPKLHSIREDLHDRWKPGMKIHHSFGVRTKSYRCFAINECISTQKIEIKVYSIDENDFLSNSYTLIENGNPYVFRVFVDSKMLSEDEINILAKNDGFDSTKDFFRWFNKSFTGKIIHWTDLRY